MKEFEFRPVVCAVPDGYMIMVPSEKEALISVKIGEKEYFNHSNGIRRSDCAVHRIYVPGKELDKARKYTVVYEQLIERRDYGSIRKAAVEKAFSFRPIKKESDINIYHLSDCHGIYKPSVKAARFFGDDLDLLVLNGDISSHSCSIRDIMLSYKIAFDVTGGEIPVIISRGNHDLRGKYAEKLEYLLPSDHGLSYYNVRLGCVWMSLVDCGEDKPDDHREYGGTAAYHAMRLDETEFLKNTVRHAKKEYAASSVKYRIVISHVPFTARNTEECRGERPFDIENDIYNEWCDIVKNEIRPDFLLAGHYHRHEIWRPGCEMDHRGVPFDVIIGGTPVDGGSMIGAAVTLGKENIRVRFTDDKGRVLGDETIKGNL